VTCQERANQILWYAAGVADEGEVRELRGHLDTGCLECAARLAEAREMLNQAPLALPPRQPPAELRQRILDGLKSPRQEAVPKRPAPALPAWGMIALPSLIAACVAAAFTIFFAWRMNSGRESQVAVELSQARETVRILEALAESQQREIGEGEFRDAAWAAAKDLRTLNLGPTSLQPMAEARIFWDPDNRKWHFFAIGLKEPPAGMQYEMWAIEGTAKPLAVGGFEPDTEGDAAFTATLPRNASPTVAAVSFEPERKAVVEPTGPFQLQSGSR